MTTHQSTHITDNHITQVTNYLKQLQADICSQLEKHEHQGGIDGATSKTFFADDWERITDGEHQGGGRSCVLSNGEVVEKGGVMFTHIKIDELPASASEHYPQLAGAKAEVMGVSVVIHPKNPNVPTSHMNVRLFIAYPQDSKQQPIWWFGGGFDLTPFYPTKEDCTAWHNNCFALCQPFGEDVYPAFKQWCDEYFYIKHRQEERGIGGLFFDNLNDKTQVGNEWNFQRCFDFIQAVGHGYLTALLPLFEKYKNTPYTVEQRDFQLYRRGRYVEFNLIYDRGTIFGLQSGGRIESILVSLPNLVSWHYDQQFDKNSPEYQLTDYYLKPRDWLAM